MNDAKKVRKYAEGLFEDHAKIRSASEEGIVLLRKTYSLIVKESERILESLNLLTREHHSGNVPKDIKNHILKDLDIEIDSLESVGKWAGKAHLDNFASMANAHAAELNGIRKSLFKQSKERIVDRLRSAIRSLERDFEREVEPELKNLEKIHKAA